MICSNCNHKGCEATRACDGCDTDLCERCYMEHNAIHFQVDNEHDVCCCDECIDEVIEENQ